MRSGLPTSLTWNRRAFITALLAGGALSAVRPLRAWGAAVPSAGDLAFDIRRDGSSIGGHHVVFRRAGERLEVDIDIDIAVNLAFIPLFAYSHRNREVWQDGRLLSLESETDDDGQRYTVSARAEGGVLRVTGSGGDFQAPADTLPTSYWNPRTVEQTRLLDSQHGRLLAVESRLLGEERLDGGKTARRYRLSGDLDLDLWYAATGEWVNIAFTARGATVSYLRRPTTDAAGAPG
ncbi:DUF6134 family protein [Pelagibius sp. 7325]|uniref:DUF6134 family protein n=1 Tax=Pelagibius sp. 7325 TaxID=3131994 RepID=UPI0030EBBCBD